uniref:Uncharacterized protein n=1 Tax=Molossus molossus TaxID=27622 RepID=A0A7J8BYL0_MOLMO|nr:hypothetical protein HJG59_010084 [Molossus molossus]
MSKQQSDRRGERKWLPHQRSDVNHQLLLVTLRDSFPLTHLEVSCPTFFYSPPTSTKDFLEVCFHPSPLAGKPQKLFHVDLVGVRRVLPSASVKNQGPFYCPSLSQHLLRETVLFFLILQMRKLCLRKAKPLT